MEQSTIKGLILGLSALVGGSAAQAQSSVSLWGVVDAVLAHGSGSLSNRTQLASGANSSSKFGLRGTEDLGGGMSAAFWLESGFTVDDGLGAASSLNNQNLPAGSSTPAGTQGLMFNRRSTVSLAGGFGELRLGRDLTPQYHNKTAFEPYAGLGVGASLSYSAHIAGLTGLRASNSIAYFLPAGLGGLYGQAQYYLGENPRNGAATQDDGTGAGVRVGYAAGPVNVAAAVARTRYAAGDVRQYNMGAQWDFGAAKVVAEYSRDQNGTLKARGFSLGSLIGIGAGVIKVAYSGYRTDAAGTPSSGKLAVGYVHNLSKRTAVYATGARLKNRGGAARALAGATTAPNESSTGYEAGIRHTF